MKVSVAGLGIVSKIGMKQDLERMLLQDEFDPAALPAGPVLAADFPDDLSVSSSLIRRMGHFAKLSLISAGYALRDAGIDLAGKSVGIIQGSVYGPIIAGLQSFDDLIDFGDNQLSPTHFTGSVFNTSATYLSLAFGIQGPTLSHTAGLDTFQASLLTAAHWLESGQADLVLLGIGDEFAPFFDQGAPAGQASGLLPTGEGWTTFVLNRDPESRYGTVEFEVLNDRPGADGGNVIRSVWHERMERDEPTARLEEGEACFPVGLRGSYPSGSAFDLALALISAEKKRFPMTDRHGKYRMKSLSPGERVRCIGRSENGGVWVCEVTCN